MTADRASELRRLAVPVLTFWAGGNQRGGDVLVAWLASGSASRPRPEPSTPPRRRLRPAIRATLEVTAPACQIMSVKARYLANIGL
jgi:hypothetical protein